jgi:sarcosine oxidase
VTRSFDVGSFDVGSFDVGSFDVIVVGAGVMGSAAAWRLAARGRSVLVLEQFQRGHARGSSHGGSRIFRYAYPDAEYVALARRARPLWAELEAEAGTTVIDVTGGVDHGDPRVIGAVGDALAAAGMPFERWSPAEASEHFPGLRFDQEVCYQPDAGRCRAAAAVDAFARVAAARGAELRERERVIAIETHGDGARVRTESGEYGASLVVVAAGAWVGELVGLAPVRATREHYVHLPSPDPTLRWPSFIHHRDPVPAYGLETPGEGVKLGDHHAGEVVTDLSAPTLPALAADARARLVAYAREWIPGVDPVAVSEATCLYTSTPSEDFVIDRVGPVVVCSPCSGHGFKFAPLVGELVAGLADGTPAPERFRLGAQNLRTSLTSAR